MKTSTTRVIQERPHRYTDLRCRDREMRELRMKVSYRERSLEAKQRKNELLEGENKRLRQKLKEKETREEALTEELEKIRRERDRYKGMLFKANKKTETEEADGKVRFLEKKKAKKRGGQIGHQGKGYQIPNEIDQTQRVFLSHCPDCSGSLKRTESIDKHTVKDIPEPESVKVQAKQYEIEKQWCKTCREIKKAHPKNVIPHSRYGINTILYVMIQKYAAKSSYDAIRFTLEKYFGLKLSEGTLVNMLRRAKEWLGPDYEHILEEVRQAKVKHADETGWRIEGINHWIWGFMTKECAYYKIDQSRGKGVPKEVLEGNDETNILVRDDYAAYTKLPLSQQSCWAHLLRESHLAANAEKASKEVQRLHRQLKRHFEALSKIINHSFQEQKRKTLFKKFESQFQKIIQSNYKMEDTKKIQTRIKRQGNNLITAILYEGVPLTNNLAEQCLRPLVITRKISHGSQSIEGAKTHMINMSVFQTILMKGQSLIPTLKSAILTTATPNY